MSLPQSIGLNCVACQKTISSIIDGTFCEECGNPVHKKCVISAAPTQQGQCPRCGGDPASEIAKEVQRERAAPAPALAITSIPAAPPAAPLETDGQEPTSEGGTRRDRRSVHLPASQGPVQFPVSEICPKCNSDQYTRVPPQNLIAFAKDRVCAKCGTRYTPPTPLWAALVFMVLGVVFLGGSIGNLIVSDNPAVIGSIFGCILGAAALGLGVRSFNNPGKV